MERSDALKPLSRDHHQGLFVAMQLRRAAEATAAEARAGFFEFWRKNGRRHFRIEEEVVLPAYARHASANEEAVVRVLTDYVELRRAGAELEAEAAPALDPLHRLGERLEALEAALPEDELAALGNEVERAEGQSA